MSRWLRIVGIGLGALVLLVVLLVVAVLGTTPGARFILSRVVPAEVEVGAVEGWLWGPLVLHDVRYVGSGMEARVARVRFDWRPTRLLRRSLEITTLQVDTADVQLLETEPAPAEVGTLPLPSVPLAVRVERLEGREVQVLTTGGDTVRTQLVRIAGGVRQDTFDLDSLRLRDFDVRGSRFQLDAGGRVVTGTSGARDSAGLDLEWEGRLADGRDIAGSGTIRGAGGALTIEHRVSAPIVASLDARVGNPWVPDSLTWTLTLDVPRFALGELRDGLAGEAELTVEASGDPGSVEARVEGRGVHPEPGPVAIDTRLAYGDGAITIDTVDLRQLEGPATLAGQGRVELGDAGPSVDARLVWSDLAWPLDSAAVASPSGSLRVAGRLEDFQVSADLALRRPDRSLGRWTVRTEGRYADSRVVIRELLARRDGGGRLSLAADVDLRDQPRGEATLQWTDLSWPPAPGDSARLTSADGRVELRGAMEDFTVLVDASLAGPAVPVSRARLDLRGDADDDAVNVRLSATGEADGRAALELTGRGSYRPGTGLVVVDTLDARLPETDGRLAFRGAVDLSDLERRLEGRLRWSDLVWPVTDPRYRSDEGEVTVTTAEGRTRVAGEARLGGITLPESRWRLAGQGGLDRFVVDSLQGAVLGGAVRVAGVVWPDSGPAWDFRVAGDTLDPGQWRPGWSGRLGFRFRTDGRLGGGGPTFQATLDSVTGTLREQPVDGGAVARGTGDGVTVDTLWLRVGGSTIAAGGSVGDSVDVTWALAAESLYDLVPAASGQLDARGRLTGSRRAPSISVTADGSGLTLAGWGAEGLTATADVVDGGEDSSTVSLTLAGVQGASMSVDSVSLDAVGTRADHTLSVLARSQDDVLEGRLTGGTSDDRWTGRLDRLRLQSAIAGDWRLRDSARVAISADSGAVEELCWVGPGELCLAASWSRDGVRWDASGRALPMELIRPALPRGLVARGQLGLETRGRTGPGPVLTGMLRVAAGAGEIAFTPDVGRAVTQPFDTLALEAESDSVAAATRLELRLGELGSVTADVTLPGAGPFTDRPIDGRVSLHIEDDGTVSRLTPAITESQGTADVEVQVAGSVSAPSFQGQVSLADVGASVTDAGIRLSDGQLTARSTGGRWQIEGGIRSDTSRLEITGFARPPDPDSTWLADITIEADRFPTVETPDLTIITSPRLAVQASPNRVIINGRLAVPRARIAVRELEGIVQTSPDVVLVGAGAEAEDSAVTPAVVRAAVQLVLGDSVSIDARGLTGRLEGQLAIEALPNRPPVGSGELEIENGQYRIYRQTFQVDRGRLLFASTPLTDPGLDLRVTRASDTVTVGMNITGRASDPRVELFSDPSMSDEEVLAYLIVGRPLRRLSQSEGGQVQNMAQSIGLAGGNLLLARLGSAFGLETARIERTNPDDEGQRQSRLVLGRRVLPRVHIDYAIGLTGAANVVRLRYMITDHWILQTESGEETGADLLYTFGGGGAVSDLPEPPTPQAPR